MSQPQQPGKKKANPDCPLCHGYGMIVEDEFQKSAPACHLCFPMKQELAKASSAPASPVEEKMEYWVSVKEKLPDEGGRYWCYVEVVGDLGESHFQWNCSFDPHMQSFSDNMVTMHVIYWQPLAPEPKQRGNTSKPSPVIEETEMNITDPETTDERNYRKLSEWYLRQLRECQEELRLLKSPSVIEIGEHDQIPKWFIEWAKEEFENTRQEKGNWSAWSCYAQGTEAAYRKLAPAPLPAPAPIAEGPESGNYYCDESKKNGFACKVQCGHCQEAEYFKATEG